MATNSPKECSVCHENFDEGLHCPRLLPCSHCICTSCIKGLITNDNRKCPYCRQPFSQDAPEDFKKIINVIDLVKYIDALEINVISGDLFHTASMSQKMEFLRAQNKAVLTQSLEECKKAFDTMKQKMENNVELKESIASINEGIKKEILAKVTEVIERNELKMAAIQKQNRIIEKQRSEIEKLEQSLLNVQEQLDECGLSAYQEAAPILDEIEETSNILKERLKILKSVLSNDNELPQIEMESANEGSDEDASI